MLPTLKQLQYLVALDDSRHFGQAAERCGVSQPSLSVQIANLEGLLNVRLIGRRRGAVIPTAAGREVIERAREILRATQSLTENARQMGSGLAITLRLGVSSSLGPYFMPRAVGALRRDYPDLKLYIREGVPRQLIEDFDHGTFDFIMSQLPVIGRGYRIAPLFREPLVLVVPADHKLAERDRVQPGDIAGQDVLTLAPGHNLYGQVRELCQIHGATLRDDYEGTSLDALRSMTGMGMGVAILPAFYVASEIGEDPDGIKAIRFERDRVFRTIGFVARQRGGNERSFEMLAEAFRTIAASQGIAGLRLER